MLSMSRYYCSAGWYSHLSVGIGTECGVKVDVAIWLVVYGIDVVRGGYVAL